MMSIVATTNANIVRCVFCQVVWTLAGGGGGGGAIAKSTVPFRVAASECVPTLSTTSTIAALFVSLSLSPAKLFAAMTLREGN